MKYKHKCPNCGEEIVKNSKEEVESGAKNCPECGETMIFKGRVNE